jgi:NADH-quinone oxidoreductase subunit J
MSMVNVLFWVFAFGIVSSAFLVILARNPVHSAMALVGAFFFLAAEYVLLWAHTIAVLQVLVYAGAIMVLFLFVIMLLSLTDADLQPGQMTLARVVGGGAATGLCLVMVNTLARTRGQGHVLDGGEVASFGTLAEMGRVIYTQYLFPFEAVSLLLLVAIVGAVVVAKARI